MRKVYDTDFSLSTKDALIGFYKFNKLNVAKDFNSHCVRVYIGCLLAPVPNIQARKKYLKFHDLHHIMAGYGIDRIGESEISAWELGARSCRKPIISIMNLFALSTGFILNPKRVTTAFYRGCKGKNLYYLADKMTTQEIDNIQLEEVAKTHLDIHNKIKYKWLRGIELAGYIIISLFIHLLMLGAGKLMIWIDKLRKKLP